MSLDFTALENIPLQIAKKTFEEPLGYEDGNLAREIEKPATDQSGKNYRLEKEKRDRGTAREIFSTYQENIRRAGSCRTDLIKGIQSGEDPLALLLTAIECISRITDDKAFLTQAEADLKTIYGWGLGEPAPLREELKQAQQRLEKLEKAEVPSGEEKRIKRAILAHREQIAKLEEAIAKAEEKTGGTA